MINVDHLTKRYGTVTAVDSLSFEVGPGRVTGFLGPNGAGKTTTLRMLLGLTAPTSGTATINGVRYRDLPNPVRTVGAALEADCFHPGRSGAEHLRIMATAAGISRRRVAQVLDIVGLAEAGHRRVGTYLTPAGARAVSGSVGGHDRVDTLETRYANAWGWRPSRPPPTIGLQTAEMTPSGAAAPTSAPRWQIIQFGTSPPPAFESLLTMQNGGSGVPRPVTFRTAGAPPRARPDLTACA